MFRDGDCGLQLKGDTISCMTDDDLVSIRFATVRKQKWIFNWTQLSFTHLLLQMSSRESMVSTEKKMCTSFQINICLSNNLINIFEINFCPIFFVLMRLSPEVKINYYFQHEKKLFPHKIWRICKSESWCRLFLNIWLLLHQNWGGLALNIA